MRSSCPACTKGHCWGWQHSQPSLFQQAPPWQPTAKFRFNFLGGLSLLLGLSTQISSLLQEHWVPPATTLWSLPWGSPPWGLFPKPGISSFFPPYTGGSVVWRNAEKGNICLWGHSHCWVSQRERSVGESLLPAGHGLEWGAAPTWAGPVVQRFHKIMF